MAGVFFIELRPDQWWILVCQVCHACWSISDKQLKFLTHVLSDFACECCKINKLSGKKRAQFLEMPAASNASSSINAIFATPRAFSTFVAVQQDGLKSFKCFPPFCEVFRNALWASYLSKSTGTSLSKANSANSSAAKKDSSEVTPSPLLSRFPRSSDFVSVIGETESFARVYFPLNDAKFTTSKNPASTLRKIKKQHRVEAKKSPSLHPLSEDFVRGVRRKVPEDVTSLTRRILIVNGAGCIVKMIGQLQSFCPMYSFVLEYAYDGCLNALDSIIDDILPMTIVIIQFGDIDLLQYELRQNGSWPAKFENFIVKMVEKCAFVYVSYIQSQIITNHSYDTAIQFNRALKNISKRNAAHFIDVLSKFMGQAWLFDDAGRRLNSLGADLLIHEWGLRITELSHLARIY